VVRRGAVMVVLMIGLHSQFEYPLWYSYFLLPAAWALGVALRDDADAAAPPARGIAPAVGRRPAGWALALAAMLLLAGASASVWDYRRVTAIFKAAPGAPPLQLRVEEGQRSVFFGHHADYAAVTSAIPVPDPDAAIARASHYLLDTRFMIAWARALAAAGDAEGASHLAARLREFRKADAEPFFAPCADAASAAQAFQCRAPASARVWHGFTRP
jgi:hypothetical protein